VALAAGIAGRLVHLQLVQSDGLRSRAESQHRRQVEVPATRGAILDRHGKELAVSLATQALFAHPRRVEDPERAAELLAGVVDLSRRELLKRLKSDKPFVWIDRFLEPDQVAAVRLLDVPVGNTEPFGLLASSKRYYPHGDLAVHVIGFADIDGNGIEGIEKQRNEELRGDPSMYLVVHDGRRGRLREMVRAPESEPHDVVLTLDAVLQHVVERELDRAMDETDADAASAILMEPGTGRILALANRPAADANHYGSAKDAARINRAVVHQFEPGSTFKIVPMAAALELGRVRPNQRFFCENGSLRTGGRTIHDVSPQGMLTAREVLEKSSNICMSKITARLEPEELVAVIRRFGFGRVTGIELPGEVRGSVSEPRKWSGLTQSSLSFGQEIGVTAVQMAAAMATVANDGLSVPPRVVLGTIDPEGHFDRAAAPAAKRVISNQTARELSAMLEGVVAVGTGRRAQIPGYRLAGKSGTAQKIVDGAYSATEYVASFGGYGPVLSPRLVALVVLDSPRYGKHRGGQAAGPAFRRIMADALGYLRIPTDEESISVARRPTTSPAALQAVRVPAPPPPPPAVGDGRVPDLRGLPLRDAIALLSRGGYGSMIDGSGTVVAQDPAAGTPLERGELCRVRLADRRN
jgi:cell division protein FtsI/penicillin-binding protein 2